MGNTIPLPTASELTQVHVVDPNVPTLGEKHGAPISTKSQTKIVVREKLFSWSGDSFTLLHEDGTIFGNNLQVKGKAFSMRDEMVIQNGTTKEPVVVCRKKIQFGTTSEFKIYTTTPVYKEQVRSGQKYNKTQDLYTFGSVERKFCNSIQYVHMTRGSNYTIHRGGSWITRNRVVQRDGLTVAMIGSGFFADGLPDAYIIAINPGIDPCLMVALCVICDELDERSQQF
jgi:uncharacterized protein YxjI